MCILHVGHLSIWTASQVPNRHTRLMVGYQTGQHRCGTSLLKLGLALLLHMRYFLLKTAAP